MKIKSRDKITLDDSVPVFEAFGAGTTNGGTAFFTGNGQPTKVLERIGFTGKDDYLEDDGEDKWWTE